MAFVMQLICQGETLANRNSRFPFDDPLTETSVNQLRQLKECVGPFSKVWTAPDLPARQTTSALGLCGESVAELAEPGYGHWAGIPIKKVIEQEHGAFQCWLSGDAPPGGENIVQVMARTGRWLSLRVAERGCQCAIVSSTVIRAIVIQLLDAPASSFQLIDIQPLSMTQLSSNGKRWHLSCLGRRMAV
ncbi:histidine phosphatase family protein [Kosakonia oryzae]|uniref:histidine phosphatase family protein n=1 Tax=Kosakonia oryzae TaxID=497725 RepID=UPI001D094940|nr:histidine phosphatase family protein [Kosakonia oryzae]UDJ81471.1 histidine phosphatase family protein [Kosakonia oryzae]